MNTKNRLHRLKEVMNQHQIDIVIIPSADPHMSEYLPKYWQGRKWLTGFTGSVGTAVIGQDFADLWTDSRYWLQADDELKDTGIALQKMGQNDTYVDNIKRRIVNNSTPIRIAIDGEVLSVTAFEELTTALGDAAVIVKKDMLADIWNERETLPKAAVYAHDARFVDKSAATKLAEIKKAMEAHQADNHLISSLDDIAWATNLRGADVDCNPVFLAHLLITPSDCVLYVDNSKLSDELVAKLAEVSISVKEYDAIKNDVAHLTGTLLIDPNKVAVGILDKLSDEVVLIKKTNPSTLLKAIKSDAELAHIKNAMVQDGAALCEFFVDFEQKIKDGVILTEIDIADMLTQKRSAQPNYVGASFETIAGFAANGAIVHYSAKEGSAKQIQGDGLLLIDSGAQYQNGTTDITRMTGVGQISDDAKRDVTYVLKAHIALAQAVFPVGVSSVVLDTIARAPMWQAGFDYGHGTGHGVGYFLNVHEGPQVIAYSAPKSAERIIALGMVTSNEPGLYRTDKWGIRIENLVACVKHSSSEFGDFAQFEDLTLCPIDTRIILPYLLNDNEKTWLNTYHQKVHNALIDKVSVNAKQWLIERTRAI